MKTGLDNAIKAWNLKSATASTIGEAGRILVTDANELATAEAIAALYRDAGWMVTAHYCD